MSDYLQRLFSRSGAVAPVPAAPQPASRIGSPVAERDQRLQMPGLGESLLPFVSAEMSWMYSETADFTMPAERPPASPRDGRDRNSPSLRPIDRPPLDARDHDGRPEKSEIVTEIGEPQVRAAMVPREPPLTPLRPRDRQIIAAVPQAIIEPVAPIGPRVEQDQFDPDRVSKDREPSLEVRERPEPGLPHDPPADIRPALHEPSLSPAEERSSPPEAQPAELRTPATSEPGPVEPALMPRADIMSRTPEPAAHMPAHEAPKRIKSSQILVTIGEVIVEVVPPPPATERQGAIAPQQRPISAEAASKIGPLPARRRNAVLYGMRWR